MGNPTHTASWKKLKGINPSNKCDFSIKNNALNFCVDLKNSLIGDEVWSDILTLAREQNIENIRDRMISGEVINLTENRSVGHIWLRDGQNADVENVLKQMQKFVLETHQNDQFTDVVHIGIGGSDLGPRMVCDALKHISKKMNVHFVANVDAADIDEILKPLNPETTLICIASKTFTTQETMMNAKRARAWLGDLDVSKHIIALSTNRDAVIEFGIDPNNMFPFWDWVGGRFSVWSAIGMPIALAYGFDVFKDFLNGARAMDDHFKTAPLETNLPVILALFGIWNRNFMDRNAMAVLPYAQNLSLFVNYLQQIDMESNGKSVDIDGQFITDYKTGPIIFGQAGTNGQHAFHQWLHQGADIVPCEFIQIKKSHYDQSHQTVLNAHADAQAQAFAEGEINKDAHRHYSGGRPSITIHMNDVSPTSLGQLMALYEHKIFVQGVIWNINSFDQFGVELGKKLAKQILA